MITNKTLLELQTYWISEVANQLATVEQLKEDLQEQIAIFFDLLIQAVNKQNPTIIDPILIEWVKTRTETELENPEASLLPVLSQIEIITFDLARKHLPNEEALETISTVLPVFIHAMEYASTEEARLHVQHITGELEKARSVLEKLEKSKSDFISVAAHELKTPLFTVQGYILTLLDGAMKDKTLRKK